MALDKHTIIKYRLTAEPLGLWDENYSSIKRDIPAIFADIRNRDYSMDLLGASIKQMELMARLLVYGHSNNDLSKQDLESLFAPFEPLKELERTPDLLDAGIDNAVDGLMPLFFRLARHAKDIHELERELREAMVIPSHITTIGLSYGIAINICLRKYDGAYKEIFQLNDYLDVLTATSGAKDDILKSAMSSLTHGTRRYESTLFSSLLAIAIVECNLRGTPEIYDGMYKFMSRLDNIAKRYDMYDYIHSNEFKLLLKGVEEFHEIGKRD